jgi:two-component system, OmpR family, response regulator ResD
MSISATTATGTAGAAPRLILVVDDMPIFREPIAASLRLSGYEAVCASDGNEAIAKLADRRPDLVLLDLAMPGMDGMNVLRRLRGDAATADLPVIMLTAAADKPRVIEAGKLGVHDYLLKSRFSLKDLLARVSKYVPPGDPACQSLVSRRARWQRPRLIPAPRRRPHRPPPR